MKDNTHNISPELLNVRPISVDELDSLTISSRVVYHQSRKRLIDDLTYCRIHTLEYVTKTQLVFSGNLRWSKRTNRPVGHDGSYIFPDLYLWTPALRAHRDKLLLIRKITDLELVPNNWLRFTTQELEAIHTKLVGSEDESND